MKNEPEKKIPSTQANAINLVANDERLSLIHLIDQSAFFLIHGKLLIASNNFVFLFLLLQEYQLIVSTSRCVHFPS